MLMRRLGQIDWRDPENLVRLGILAVVIAAIVAALLLRDDFGAAQVGYGAVVLSALVASAGTDWSTKTARGREIRLALELAGRGDDPAQTAVLAQRVEQRIATLAPQQAGYLIVVTQFLRSRVERRRRGLRAVLLEYRFTLIETE